MKSVKSNITYLSYDTLSHILLYISSSEDFHNILLISKLIYKIINSINVKWICQNIKFRVVKSSKFIKNYVTNIEFVNYFNILKFFPNFRKVYFNDCCEQITDEGLKHLKGVHTIDLSFCDKITDEGLKHFKDANQHAIIYKQFKE